MNKKQEFTKAEYKWILGYIHACAEGRNYGAPRTTPRVSAFISGHLKVHPSGTIPTLAGLLGYIDRCCGYVYVEQP